MKTHENVNHENAHTMKTTDATRYEENYKYKYFSSGNQKKLYVLKNSDEIV